MTALWNACERYLNQARTLVATLSPAQFSAPHAHCHGGSIGEHLRHCLDHIEGFQSGIQPGAIDYDDRKRGRPDEVDPEAAGARLDKLIGWFREHSGRFEHRDCLRIKVDCGGECEPGWEESTVGRELQFLVSHTVHHFAIIGIMCGAQAIALDPEFGIAPSTLKHQRGA